MYQKFKIHFLTLLFFLAAASGNYSTAGINSNSSAEKSEGIIVDLIVEGVHQMSWDPMLGSGPYSVTVLNMTTSTLHSQFSTSSTSSLLYGLTVGNTYRFVITKAADAIIVSELIICG